MQSEDRETKGSVGAGLDSHRQPVLWAQCDRWIRGEILSVHRSKAEPPTDRRKHGRQLEHRQVLADAGPPAGAEG